MKNASYKHSLFFLITTFICFVSIAQPKKIIGFVKDKQSDEPIPFVSVFLQSAKTGGLTDTLGRFSISTNQFYNNDSLQISSVGYKIVSIPLSLIKDSASFVVHLEVLPLVSKRWYHKFRIWANVKDIEDIIE